MKNLKVFSLENVPSLNGSSLAGYLDVTYDQLVKLLGEPTYDVPSGDDKVQVEWVMEFKGNVYTIYDWKTYNVVFTKYELDRFHVGSKVNASEFISFIESKLLSL